MSKALQCIGLVVILSLTAIVYSDHFHGAFHIDDIHTIINNAYIRDLHNIPQFFSDGTMSSSQPTNQTYRPVLTATLALDYHWGSGTADTLVYHLTSFGIFLCLGISLFFLSSIIFRTTGDRNADRIALLATAWFMLHPLSAETVCYIIQRGDLLATLFVILGLLLYSAVPLARRFFLYLVPVGLAILTKPVAVVFPLLLGCYIILLEGPARDRKWAHIIIATIVAGAISILVYTMTPSTYQPSGEDAWLYRCTQPYVLGFYFLEWFAPLWLAADHGSHVFATPWVPMAWFGYLFIILLSSGIYYSWRRTLTRPIAFGLAWYLLANIPTSWISLNEVATDHRMFLPDIGLSIAISWALYLLIDGLGRRLGAVLVVRYVALGIAALGILIYAYCAWQRTLVWQTEESLWADAVSKYPASERAHLDYGLALLRRHALPGAEAQFAYILQQRPDYHIANLDMGVVKHEEGKDIESGIYLRHAVETGRDACPPCYYYYAMYLHQQGQTQEAIAYLYKAWHLSAANVEARELLMELLYDQHRASELMQVTEEVLRVSPVDSKAAYYKKLLTSVHQLPTPTTPQGWLDLSGQAYREGRYQECIDEARRALELKPDYAESYNNIAAAANKLGKYADAKDAAGRALRLDPHSRFAQINLEVAQRGLQQAAGHQ